MVGEEQLLAWGELSRYNSYSLLVYHFLLYGWISIFSYLCGHRFAVLVWIRRSICLSEFNDTWFQENLNQNLRSGRKTGRENFAGMVRNREERRNEFFWRLRGFWKFFEAGWCWLLAGAGAGAGWCWLASPLPPRGGGDRAEARLGGRGKLEEKGSLGLGLELGH